MLSNHHHKGDERRLENIKVFFSIVQLIGLCMVVGGLIYGTITSPMPVEGKIIVVGLILTFIGLVHSI